MSGTLSRRTALKGIGGALAAATLTSAQAAANDAGEQGASARRQATSAARKRRTGKPNILWITGEGVPVSALSCYDSKLIETPNIDRIAKEGVRFRNAFTTNALCAPSRATLLSGTYSHINGTIANPGIQVISGEPEPTFDENQVNVARLLKQNGYQTGYEAVTAELVLELKKLRDLYRDRTGLPVVATPVND